MTPEREAELLPWIRVIEESFPNDDQTRALQDLRDGLAFERKRADTARASAFAEVHAWLERMVASGFSADKIVAELPEWLDRMTRQP